MDYKIDEIEGIGPAYGEKLKGVGIDSTNDFLTHCASRKGREEIAGKTGISEKLLLKWSNMADLMRIKGVGKQFAELLEAAGVDTIKELRHRRADNLSAKMGEINAQKKVAKSSPAESVVAGWIEEAKQLEPKISH